MTAHDHIDEFAELYALGALNDSERSSVDAHVRVCESCAKRLGEAEWLIAQAIPEREPPRQLDRRVHAAFTGRSPRTLRLASLIAAAFVLGLLPGMLFALLYHPATAFDADRDRAIGAMVTSHFVHAQFKPLIAGAPKAKVLYGRTGHWRFFVAQTRTAYSVVAVSGGNSSRLGVLHVQGDAAELFVPDNTARTFLLLDGSRPVARVSLP